MGWSDIWFTILALFIGVGIPFLWYKAGYNDGYEKGREEAYWEREWEK